MDNFSEKAFLSELMRKKIVTHANHYTRYINAFVIILCIKLLGGVHQVKKLAHLWYAVKPEIGPITGYLVKGH